MLRVPDLAGNSGGAVRDLAVLEDGHDGGEDGPLHQQSGSGIVTAGCLLRQGVGLHRAVQPISVRADGVHHLHQSGLDIADLTFVCECLHLLDLDSEWVTGLDGDLWWPWTTTDL